MSRTRTTTVSLCTALLLGGCWHNAIDDDRTTRFVQKPIHPYFIVYSTRNKTCQIVPKPLGDTKGGHCSCTVKGLDVTVSYCNMGDGYIWPIEDTRIDI